MARVVEVLEVDCRREVQSNCVLLEVDLLVVEKENEIRRQMTCCWRRRMMQNVT